MNVVVHPYYRPRLGDAFGGAVSDVLRGPVLPHISGMQFMKIAAVGFVAVWLLKGVGKAFGTQR